MIKKIILSLLILSILILTGCRDNITGGVVVCNKPYLLVGSDCCLDKNDNSICDKDEIEDPIEQVEPPKEEIKEEPIVEEKPVIKEEPIVEEIEEETPVGPIEKQGVKEGNVITFENKKIIITNIGFFQGRLAVTVDVEGTELEIYDTKNPEIIKDLKIQILKFDQLKDSITIKIEKFELGIDEYKIGTRTELELFGKQITFRDILDDGAILFDVQQGDNIDSKLHLDEGESLTVQGITITNIEGFPRLASGVKLEKYAIISVK